MLFPKVEDFLPMTILKEVCFTQFLLLRVPIIYLKEQPDVLHIFPHRESFLPELFKMRRSKTGYYFTLELGEADIIEFVHYSAEPLQ